MSAWDKINDISVDYLHCPYCEAVPGVWCKTKSNRWATWLHSGRTQMIRDLVYEAYQEGIEEEKKMAQWRAEIAEQRRAQAQAG